MKKNRTLSLILSVIMMLTVLFPAGMFAEEITDDEITIESLVFENVEAEEPAEQPVLQIISEDEDEEPAAEAPALIVIEEEEAPFEQGYVRVNGGTIVYADESKQEEKGAFSGDAVVYAAVSTRAANEANSWLRIVFDTVEANEADEALLSGYVQFKDVNVLSDAAVEQLIESLKDDFTVRSYNDKLLPLVSFDAKSEEAVLQIVEEEDVIAAAVTAASVIVITKEPADFEGAVGETATFKVEATGVASYLWKYSKNGGETWIVAAGTNNKATYKPGITATRYGFLYCCELTGTDGSTKSTKSVKMLRPSEIEIVKEPEDTEGAVGEYVTFAVEANGVASYLWKYSKDGETWSNAAGTRTNAEYRVAVTNARYGFLYSCEMTGTDGTTKTTKTVKILRPSSIQIVKEPEDTEGAVGEYVTFTVEANGVASYLWKYSKDGETWNNAAGTRTNAEYRVAVTNARYGYLYHCELTGTDGSTKNTQNVKILRPSALEIVKEPEDYEAAVGEYATFTVEANGVASYLWKYSKDGETWNNAAGTRTNAEYRVAVTNTRYGFLYCCELTGTDGTTKTTKSVKILRPATLEIVKEPEDTEGAVGEYVTFTVEANGVASYLWKYSKDGETWNNAAGTRTNAEYRVAVTNARYGFLYCCELTGTDGSTKTTKTVKILRPVAFEIVTEPEDFEGEVGGYATFTVEATGVESYLWKYSKDGGKTWIDAAGTNTNATYKAKITETRYGFLYHCEMIGYDGTTKATKEVKILRSVVNVDGVLYKALTDSTCYVFGYTGQASSIVIPETIEGLGTVTEIGAEAFLDNTTLVSIDLPDTITVIRAKAFKGCTNLSTMK